MQIVLDIGHGQDNRAPGVFDPGAKGNGTREYDEAKGVVLGIAPLLRAHGHEVMVIDGGDFRQRAPRADAWGADLYISVHLNSHSTASAHGTETFVHPQAGVVSRRLAVAIQGRMVAALATRDRGIKEEDFAVLGGRAAAVLLEIAFISNTSDMIALRARRGALIVGIAEGILTIAGKTAKEEDAMSINYVYQVLARKDAPTKEAALVKVCQKQGLNLVRLDPDTLERRALVGRLTSK